MICIHPGVVINKTLGSRTDAYLTILNEIGFLSKTFSSNVTRNFLASIRNLFTSLWVAKSFLSIERALVVCQNPHAHPSFSYDFLHHAGQFSTASYNHLQIFQELQIWLLALPVLCTNFASHHIKTELMASVTGKWLDNALEDQQWN